MALALSTWIMAAMLATVAGAKSDVRASRLHKAVISATGNIGIRHVGLPTRVTKKESHAESLEVAENVPATTEDAEKQAFATPCVVTLYEHWPEEITAQMANSMPNGNVITQWVSDGAGAFKTGKTRVLSGPGVYPLGDFSNMTSSVKVAGECCKAYGDCAGTTAPILSATEYAGAGFSPGVVAHGENLKGYWTCHDCSECVKVEQVCPTPSPTLAPTPSPTTSPTSSSSATFQKSEEFEVHKATLVYGPFIINKMYSLSFEVKLVGYSPSWSQIFIVGPMNGGDNRQPAVYQHNGFIYYSMDCEVGVTGHKGYFTTKKLELNTWYLMELRGNETEQTFFIDGKPAKDFDDIFPEKECGMAQKSDQGLWVAGNAYSTVIVYNHMRNLAYDV